MIEFSIRLKNWKHSNGIEIRSCDSIIISLIIAEIRASYFTVSVWVTVAQGLPQGLKGLIVISLVCNFDLNGKFSIFLLLAKTQAFNCEKIYNMCLVFTTGWYVIVLQKQGRRDIPILESSTMVNVGVGLMLRWHMQSMATQHNVWMQISLNVTWSMVAPVLANRTHCLSTNLYRNLKVGYLNRISQSIQSCNFQRTSYKKEHMIST